VADEEKQYSDYLKDLSKSRMTILSLITGFTFTTITLLLNQLTGQNSLLAQLTLAFLTIIFNVFLFLLQWQMIILIGAYYLRNPPPRYVWDLSVFNVLMVGAFSLWGLSLVLIFLLRNLVYVALLSVVMWTLFSVFTGVAINGMLKRLGWSPREELKKLRTHMK
jgi:hypothetical protein